MQPEINLETGVIVDQAHPDQPPNDLAAISELISGGDAEQPEPQEAAEPTVSSDEPERAEPETGIEVEEVEPEQIDYERLVPMPDGQEPVSIGQLKDFYREHGDLQQERDDWETARSKQQGELMATRQQLLELADMMQDVKPEVVEYLQQINQQQQQREAALLLQVFPEWSDPEKKAQARTKHLETVKEYGFNEIEYSQISDHRIIRLLQDLTRYRAREAAGKARAEQIKTELPKGQKSVPRRQTDAQRRRAMVERAKAGSEQDKLSAISTLIRG